MKNWVLLVALVFSGCVTDQEENWFQQIGVFNTDASIKHSKKQQRKDRARRVSVADTFKTADRVEIYLLEFSIGEDTRHAPKKGDEVFPVRPYGTETKVLNKRTVLTSDVPKWSITAAKLVASDKKAGGAFCHYPIHGIRIYAGDLLLFETSICWVCDNYYFTYDDASRWVGLNEDANDLKALLDQFMPVPETEKARFKAKSNPAQKE